MRTRTRFAFATAVCLTAAGQASAAQTTATRACSADEVVGWVGLEQLECNCTVVVMPGAGEPDDAHWSFRSEPVVGDIAPGSPAAHVLRRGDVIVAVDGHLITTAEGGRRFSQPAAGEPLALRIRRDGRTMTVRLTPLALCRTDRRLAVQTPRASTDDEFPRSPRPRGQPSRAPAPSPPPPVPAISLLPAGRLGFGVSCSSCGWVRGDPGEEARLFFEGPLQVYSVESGSPADRAGLRRGDVITHVDGLAIASRAGARRFAGIEPDETVQYTIRRGTATDSVVLRAADRTADDEVMSRRELRERLERISRMRDFEAAQREIVALARELEGAANTVSGRASAGANRLRYSGQVGEAEVEVRGASPVIATVLEADRDLRIVTEQTTIRIRIPRGGGR